MDSITPHSRSPDLLINVREKQQEHTLRIHCLQHEYFEGVANIGRWAEENGHPLTHTLFYEDGPLPRLDEFDLLVVMGGHMGVYEEAMFGWLKKEKAFIKDAIAAGKYVLGICLGSQLLAEALGARVFKGPHREVGWRPVSTTDEAAGSPWVKSFPKIFYPLHWHGDTFDLPQGAVRLASSDAYRNQAFQYGDRLLGFQFHLELSFQDVRRFLKWQRATKKLGPFEQSKDEILSRIENFEVNRYLLSEVLKAIEARIAAPADVSTPAVALTAK